MSEAMQQPTAARPYDTILFDLGYTLIHFEPEQDIIVQNVLRELGVERSTEEIMAAVRATYGAHYHDAETATFPATAEFDRQVQRNLIEAILAHLDIETEDQVLTAYSEALESWFRQPGVIRPYPETRPVLQALTRDGYRLGVVSNWSWDLQERVAFVELADFFQVIWGSAYAGCNKPHPGIFYQALARMLGPRPQPNRVLYVGDSYRHDVIGARNAGLDAVLLDRKGNANEADCLVISDLCGLFAVIGKG